MLLPCLLAAAVAPSMVMASPPRPDCPGGSQEACVAAECDGEAPRFQACVNRCTLLCAAAVCERATSQPPPLTEEQMTSAGPPSGSLVVAGGSIVSESAIYDEFAALALGIDKSDYIVFVPTANGGPFETPAQIEAAISGLEGDTGWNVRALVHTYDPEVANTPEFVQEIDKATGVWFGGGRQWRIADAYLGTLAQSAFERVLERGGVIGGSSAGAAFQGDLMVRGNRDPNDLSILLDPDHIEGFGYATGVGFDPHHIPRGRLDDDIELSLMFPTHLGIGLDENTAVVITGDEMRVVSPAGTRCDAERSAGGGYVVMVDNTLWEEEGAPLYCGSGRTRVIGRPRLAMGGKSFVLMDGDVYDLRTREILVQLNAQVDIGGAEQPI
jgi:cyanophycinase